MTGEKPFAATAARIARARQDGDVPRSTELCAVATFAAAAVALLTGLGPLAGATHVILFAGLRGAPAPPGAYVLLVVWSAAPLIAGLAGATLATAVVGGGIKPVVPKLAIDKLNPMAGLRRMFSRDSLVTAGVVALSALAASLTVVPIVHELIGVGLQRPSPAMFGVLAGRALLRVLCVVLAVGVAFAIVDVAREREKWHRRLRMSHDELRRDHRQSEGDPLVRSRRRHAHRALLRGSIARLPEAAFIVTNPTHIAVALAYAPPEIAVPRVLVRAIDRGALELKRRGRLLGIPLIENVGLARLLLTMSHVGDVIPAEAYLPVAAIVASLSRQPRE